MENKVELRGKLKTYLNTEDAGVEVWISSKNPLEGVTATLIPDKNNPEYRYDFHNFLNQFEGRNIVITITEL